MKDENDNQISQVYEESRFHNKYTLLFVQQATGFVTCHFIHVFL